MIERIYLQWIIFWLCDIPAFFMICRFMSKKPHLRTILRVTTTLLLIIFSHFWLFLGQCWQQWLSSFWIESVLKEKDSTAEKGGGEKSEGKLCHVTQSCNIWVINLPWKKTDTEKTSSKASTLESQSSYWLICRIFTLLFLKRPNYKIS